MSEVKAKQPDVMYKMKYISYCRVLGPVDKMTLDDLVQHAKFQLCLVTKTLFKDPVWDSYTKEEILIEWFSHQFHNDPKKVQEFEMSLAKGEILDFSAWADLQMKKEQQEKEAKIKALDDKISFSPSDVMGDA